MFHVAPIVMPSDLTGRSNGELALALLAPADRGALHFHAARSWAAMAEAAARDGITLRATSAVDTYRTLTRQTAAFRERYTRNPHPGRPTKQWQGVTWWLLPGMAPTATPGTSNHGWGLAIDVCTVGELGQPVALAPSGNPTSIARRAWDWLVDHYESYGWSHEYSSPGTEPWHIRYVLGDETPLALIPPEPTPEPIVTTRSVDMIVLDFEPDTDNWTALILEAGELRHLQDGNTVDVLAAASVPRQTITQAQFIGVLRDYQADGPCPVPAPSPALLHAWNNSAGIQ